MNEPIQQVKSTTLRMCTSFIRRKSFKLRTNDYHTGSDFMHIITTNKNFVYFHVRYARRCHLVLFIYNYEIFHWIAFAIQFKHLIALSRSSLLSFYAFMLCAVVCFLRVFFYLLFHSIYISTDKKALIYRIFVYMLGVCLFSLYLSLTTCARRVLQTYSYFNLHIKCISDCAQF